MLQPNNRKQNSRASAGDFNPPVPEVNKLKDPTSKAPILPGIKATTLEAAFARTGGKFHVVRTFREFCEMVRLGMEESPIAVFPAKKYFGFSSPPKFSANKNAATAPALPEFEIVQECGHAIEPIIDHLLISKSLNSLSPVASVMALYPVPEDKQRTFAQALRNILEKFKLPTHNGLMDAEADSTDRLTALYLENTKHWVSEKRHPFIGNSAGRFMLVEPSLSYASDLLTAHQHSTIHIFSNSMWEAAIFAGMCSSRKQAVHVTPHAISKNLLKGDTPDYQCIVVDASKIDVSAHYQNALLTLPKLLRPGGQIVLEYLSFPHNRMRIVQAEHRKLIERLLNEGQFSFELKLGKTKAQEISGRLERVFYPAALKERDSLVFTRSGNVNVREELSRLKHSFRVLESLASLQDSEVWNGVENCCAKESLSDGGFFQSVLFAALRRFNIESDQSRALKLKAKGQLEEFAQFVVEKQVFGMHDPGRPISLPEMIRQYQEVTSALLDNQLTTGRKGRKTK